MIIIGGQLPPTEKPWLQLDSSGKIALVDWDMAEQFAATYAAGQRDQNAVTGALVVAVREHILNAKIPDLPKTGGKP